MVAFNDAYNSFDDETRFQLDMREIALNDNPLKLTLRESQQNLEELATKLSKINDDHEKARKLKENAINERDREINAIYDRYESAANRRINRIIYGFAYPVAFGGIICTFPAYTTSWDNPVSKIVFSGLAITSFLAAFGSLFYGVELERQSSKARDKMVDDLKKDFKSKYGI